MNEAYRPSDHLHSDTQCSHEADCIESVVVVSMNVKSAAVSAMRDGLAKASYTSLNSLK